MRISELSNRSGRSVPTIKYYLREGLLPAGRLTATNQAEYGEDHLRRLRLITTLVEVGGLPIANVRQVLDAIDDEAASLHDVVGTAHHALALRSDRRSASPELAATHDEIDGYVAKLGWRVKDDAPARRELAAVLTSLRELGWQVDPTVFDHYAHAADQLARWELSRIPATANRTDTVEAVVVGTIIFEAALIALRRLAEEHHSAAQLGARKTKRGKSIRPRADRR